MHLGKPPTSSRPSNLNLRSQAPTQPVNHVQHPNSYDVNMVILPKSRKPGQQVNN